MQEAVRDALIAFMAATAQAQAEATREAQRAGIEAAKGDPKKYRGKKPSYDQKALEAVLSMAGEGGGTAAIAQATGLIRQTVLRIKGDPTAAHEAVKRWASWCVV